MKLLAKLLSPFAGKDSPNLKAAKLLLKKWKDFEVQTDDFLELFASPDVEFILEEFPPMSARDLASSRQAIHDSFPDDASFDHKSIREDGYNIVVVEDLVFSGTHTGAPYTPIPGKLPAIPASGVKVVNDKEKLFISFNQDHKITQIRLVAFGSRTGPTGVYQQIGGTLDF